MSALSLEILYLIKKKNLKIYSMFCYPINKINYNNINIYRQGFGILFRSVILLMLLTLYRLVLCYEIFKKWPLLSLFPSCLWKELLFISLNNNFRTLNSCSGLFPFLTYNLIATMSDYLIFIFALPRSNTLR